MSDFSDMAESARRYDMRADCKNSTPPNPFADALTKARQTSPACAGAREHQTNGESSK